QEVFNLPHGEDFVLAEEQPFVVATAGKDDAGVYRFDVNNQAWQALMTGKGEYEQLAIAEDGKQIGFLADMDTTKSRIDYYDLYYWNEESSNASQVISRNADWITEGWLISGNGRLSFSENGDRLFFGVAPEPVLQDTALLPEEIVQVEVWNYKDEMLYTQQEVRANREKRRTYQCVYFTQQDKAMQLATEELPEVVLSDEGNGVYAMGYTEKPYYKSASWESGPSRRDVYLINLQTGAKKQIFEAIKARPAFSPEAQFIYWYSYPDMAWFAYEIANEKTVQLTNNDQVSFYDELNDRPMLPSPYGIAGWTKDDDFLLIYDRYDIWLVDPSKELASNNLTNGRSQQRVSRYVWVDREQRAIEEVEPMLVHFSDEESRQQGYYWFNIHTGTKNVVQQSDYAYERRPIKAKDANNWLFAKESYAEFRDLQFSMAGLENAQKITNVNPQQDDYKWGTMELYSWTAPDGQKLEGLLVKPDGFDPNKKYPMIVNFYERSSQRLHSHRTPTPGRSTINYPHYASRGYLIFNPDVPYKIGYPGESAYDAVISGTAALINEGFVDRENIGLQGHSWGGYQIAHIITKTDMFKCVESGAPVVNMTSAYGGIRWGSGMSRMFQYEQTQSRIGGTLWDKPLRYIENSPIFFADKINTPVLILHNDEDGAVPWYQGIEFFVAMRRLGKPAWLLNYNGEPHWPLKLQNRKDFQTRMAQFFDHYLLGEPMPRWMDEGVPATEKGINQRLELMDRN
ncbi:MAG: prolyl oligopeptidase family serine peptidase, partial [Bacteroidota bacterium]